MESVLFLRMVAHELQSITLSLSLILLLVKLYLLLVEKFFIKNIRGSTI